MSSFESVEASLVSNCGEFVARKQKKAPGIAARGYGGNLSVLYPSAPNSIK